MKPGSATQPVELPASAADQQAQEVLFPALSLVAGLYRVTLSLSVTPYGISSSTVGYFTVQRQALIAQIDCGHARTVSRNTEIVLNASRSYDPNDPDGDQELSFEWFCDASRNISCFNSTIKRDGAVVVFPARFFSESTTFEFVVNVSAPGGQSAEAKQIVTLVEDDIPPLCVR